MDVDARPKHQGLDIIVIDIEECLDLLVGLRDISLFKIDLTEAISGEYILGCVSDDRVEDLDRLILAVRLVVKPGKHKAAFRTVLLFPDQLKMGPLGLVHLSRRYIKFG